MCTWFGVDCMDDEFGQSSLGRVKMLNLSSNGLEGTLPEELGLLQLDIREIDVSDNSIGGSLPEKIFDLTNLSKSLSRGRRRADLCTKTHAVVNCKFASLGQITFILDRTNFGRPFQSR